MKRNMKVTADSQFFQLVNRLEEAAVSHGFKGDVTIRHVRVDEGVLRFCEVRGPVKVLLQDAAGDGGELPGAVYLQKTILAPDEPGYYDLEAHLHVNGALTLEVTALDPVPA